MRILFASSEVFPYSKTGGLGDAVGALGRALAQAGHEVITVTPLYRGVRQLCPKLEPVDWRFHLSLGPQRNLEANVLKCSPATRYDVFFIDKPEYFDRVGIYGESTGDYRDNAERFIFFSKCAVHLAQHLQDRPQVIHVHDWPTGLIPTLVQNERLGNRWANSPKVCLTIHNLAYQGVFPKHTFGLTNLPAQFYHTETAEFFNQVNFLKAGIASADAVTTVSPRYAREITTQEFGAGLDGLLRKRQKSLFGILNGVDYKEWNTTRNERLPATYSASNLSGKAVCKAALQKRLGLPVAVNVPVFGAVTRLVEQKGIDLTLGALEEMLSSSMQFVLLGSGSQPFQRALVNLQQRHPDKVACQFGYDDSLAHQIEAGSDFYLMPSRFEPCGLNQMYSLRYGTIPIVRRTGGLDDSVIDASDDIVTANGIKFNEANPQALAKAIRKAILLYAEPELMVRYQRAGMRADFSWDRSVKEYESIYA